MADILVIGGGAAGMMAAIAAASEGACVTLLERNEKLGRKIYITGKGRCNCTNDCSIDDFLREVPRNPRFLYSALTAFTPQDMMSFLEDAHCPVVVQRGHRVFPATEKASDVTRALERCLREKGVRVCLNSRVRSLTAEDGRVTGAILTDGKALRADEVIIATGGLSYPGTGSTGDGYRLAQEAGHTIIPARASLSALETKETWPMELQGLALKNVRLTLKRGKKSLYDNLGEMLFTHFGISGPLVLEMSCHLPETLEGLDLRLDLKPGLTPEQLDARLQRDLQENQRRQLHSILPGLLPASFARIFPELAQVSPEKLCGQLTKAERERLGHALKSLPLTISKLRPVDEAIVTRGGISVKEIDPRTMQSKLFAGLYFAGEVIDVDAHTGGFNLHIAFSTGRLAGQSAARASLEAT